VGVNMKKATEGTDHRDRLTQESNGRTSVIQGDTSVVATNEAHVAIERW
jgi:hypothetical protein